MDERDEDGYESETETFADPITERVRIIGAEAGGDGSRRSRARRAGAGHRPGPPPTPTTAPTPSPLWPAARSNGRAPGPTSPIRGTPGSPAASEPGARSRAGWTKAAKPSTNRGCRPSCPIGPIPPPVRCRPSSTDAARTTRIPVPGRHRGMPARPGASTGTNGTTARSTRRCWPTRRPGWVRWRRYRSKSASPGSSTTSAPPAGGTPVPWDRPVRPGAGRVRLGDGDIGPGMASSSATSTQDPTEAGYATAQEVSSGRVNPAGANGVPSISSSPLRGSSDPCPRRAIPGARRRRRPPAPEVSGSGGGRNVPLSIATGLGFAAVAVACFELGSVATVALSTVVVVLAAAEAYAAFRRSGSHPATLLGLVATAAAMVAAYAKGRRRPPARPRPADRHLDGLVPGGGRAGIAGGRHLGHRARFRLGRSPGLLRRPAPGPQPVPRPPRRRLPLRGRGGHGGCRRRGPRDRWVAGTASAGPTCQPPQDVGGPDRRHRVRRPGLGGHHRPGPSLDPGQGGRSRAGGRPCWPPSATCANRCSSGTSV